MILCTYILLLASACGPASSSSAQPESASTAPAQPDPAPVEAAPASVGECSRACAERPDPAKSWCWTADECRGFCTANAVDDWEPAKRAAFGVCAREDPLCYQTLEQCMEHARGQR